MTAAGEARSCLFNDNLPSPFKDGKPSPLRGIPGGDNPFIIKPDLLHNFNLGMGGDLWVSTLFALCRMGVFNDHGRAIQKRLDCAFEKFETWCSWNRKTAHIKTKNFPQKTGRAHDTALLCKWLKSELDGLVPSDVEVAHQPLLEVMQWTFGCVNDFFHRIHSEGLWMSSSSAQRVVWCGYDGSEGYGALASLSHDLRWRLYKLKPKGHMFLHTSTEMMEAIEMGSPKIVNPLSYACWTDEDYIGSHQDTQMPKRAEKNAMSPTYWNHQRDLSANWYNVKWLDPADCNKGFEYLYLLKQEPLSDYEKLPAGTVEAHKVSEAGEERYVLDAIIGEGMKSTAGGIGVENLRGSGLIAGETSRAYQEGPVKFRKLAQHGDGEDTFTLSYITGRSVGIGAYLNRLGQRNIQMVSSPMILTGYGALNKLLGKNVYSSQDQLGGPQIMVPNGVTHQVVRDDQEGMSAILDWLSFVPKDISCPPPMSQLAADPWDRDVEFEPSPYPYDPRDFLRGVIDYEGRRLRGFFDAGSWSEYLRNDWQEL
eukprot:s771_g14.t1